MLFLPEDARKLTLYLQSVGNFDSELMEECSPSLERYDYTDAVRKAFLVLEKAIRGIVSGLPDLPKLRGQETGRQLILIGFGPDGDGPLAKKLELAPKQAKDLRDLYTGAFGVFRNPSAHDIDAAYDAENARLVLLIVNALVRQLKAANSPEAALNRVLGKREAQPHINAILREVISQLGKRIADMELNIGERQIGVYSHNRSFASLKPNKGRLEINLFTRGEILPGTRVLSARNAPRWGSLSVKSKNQIEKVIDILTTSQQRLVLAIENGEPTGTFAGGKEPAERRQRRQQTTE